MLLCNTCIHLHPYSVFGSDGTTDVTRTMHFGTPSAFEKVNFNVFFMFSK